MAQNQPGKDPSQRWDDKNFTRNSDSQFAQDSSGYDHDESTQWLGGNSGSQHSKIMKVRKNASGDITDVMLENGNVFSINEAIMMAKDGVLEGVNVGSAKNGREFLRANPNGISSDNLDNLPTF